MAIQTTDFYHNQPDVLTFPYWTFSYLAIWCNDNKWLTNDEHEKKLIINVKTYL